VAREAYPDHFARKPDSPYFDPKASADDPRWYMVDVEFVRRFPVLVSLETLKHAAGLENMVVTTRSRLSVQPVMSDEFDIVCELGDGEPA
jgi:predicted RNA-binding protein with PUA-like domain